MKTYLLAHDLGTSGNKAVLYDEQGSLCASTLYEYQTDYPEAGFVEQDPEDWWRAVCSSTRELIAKAKISPGQIACVSFSGQMMGCLLVDRQGIPLRRMIIWADTRSQKQERRMIEAIGEERGYQITGHRLSASYGGAKLLWIKENEPEVYRNAYKMLNAKDYMIYRLTGNFVTDYSDASSTNLFDLRKKQWSEEILQELAVPKDLLPQLHASTDMVGAVSPEAARQTGLLSGTPVIAGGGDGSCACVGAGVVRPGKTYHVLGSSSWISMASEEPVFDPAKRTFNWVHLDPELYTPCGTMQAAGVSLQWFKNTFCQEESRLAAEQGVSPYQLIDQMVAQSVPGANGLLYLPYLLGERSPRWNPAASGVLLGLRTGSSRGDCARAVLEGVGYNLRVILDIFRQTRPIGEITVIGGGAKGKVWLQILADIFQMPLQLPRYLEEATSMGAAVCGGIGAGIFDSFDVIDRFNPTEEMLYPREEYAARYEKLYQLFNQAYDCLLETYTGLAGIR
ncbi:xylulokinase [Massilimaliae timonensis]|uniref:Xylulose kinase n=1 Tax=Massiliimalia timonensis TaxID=1987501 RepID=A0A8J6TWY7_9FIRM|nr:xylulokinase [Massiliimalia timonensis]MBC8610390.1 xylulokinase [Massiliimalia timonensis]